MHNRELKPKLTVSSARDKRSYQFLMGLVRNQSGFEITKANKNSQESLMDFDDSESKIDMKAAGDLMEMLVKISSHPKEWKSVHEMLVEIDNDLQKSKQILDQIQKASPKIDDKKSHSPEHQVKMYNELKVEDSTHRQPDIKKWPFDGESFVLNEPHHNLYEQNVNNNGDGVNGILIDPTKVAYQHNFAYHRVTGKPLYHHTNSNNKGPKAYIAVSVIAPKNPTSEREDMDLENELRQLKPWTHQQNLKNMADIRSKWVIQSSKESSNEIN